MTSFPAAMANVLIVCAVIALITVPATSAQKKIDKLAVKPTPGAPPRTPIKALPLTSRQSNPRPKRSISHIITDCIHVTSEDGRFFTKSKEDSDQVCGVYFTSEPEQVIELHFDFLDVPCEGGGLVAFVDGWELSGQVFPSPSDHKKAFEDRFDEFCGVNKVKQVLRSSQNAALLQYRLPRRGQAFSFTVHHAFNPTPCNILLDDSTSIYTLRNYGKQVNCSLTTMYPARFRFLALSVGVQSLFRDGVETGILHKCRKRGLQDYLEIGGSLGLDSDRLNIAGEICGLNSKSELRDLVIGCPMSTVRMVSSGKTDNSVTFTVHPADADDFLDSEILCQL